MNLRFVGLAINRAAATGQDDGVNGAARCTEEPRSRGRTDRLVALIWIPGLVRHAAARRELLYELDQSRQQLLRSDPESDLTKNIDRAYANLLWVWAEV